MADVLIASDASWVVDDIRAVLTSDDTVRAVDAGEDVLPAVLEREPDLVVLDFQIGNMGGMATCLDLRLEEGAGRLDHVPVLMLVDRRADVFLAKRSQADGWLLKPLDPVRTRKAIRELLAGRTYHDESFRPPSAAASGAAAR